MFCGLITVNIKSLIQTDDYNKKSNLLQTVLTTTRKKCVPAATNTPPLAFPNNSSTTPSSIAPSSTASMRAVVPPTTSSSSINPITATKSSLVPPRVSSFCLPRLPVSFGCAKNTKLCVGLKSLRIRIGRKRGWWRWMRVRGWMWRRRRRHQRCRCPRRINRRRMRVCFRRGSIRLFWEIPSLYNWTNNCLWRFAKTYLYYISV